MGFPTSPSDEDIYTNANGTRYQYDAIDNKWVIIGGAYNVDTLSVNNLTINEALNSNVYYCSSQADINAALTSIGSGGGKIILNSSTITLTSTITISGGGTYVIEGYGDESVIDCNGDRAAFNITSASSIVLRNFKVDASDLIDGSGTTNTIIIGNIGGSPVIIDGITIAGTTTYGLGIFIENDNTIIKTCNISTINYAIRCEANSIIIIGNSIKGCGFVSIYGLASNYVIINGNIIDGNDVSSSLNTYGILINNCDRWTINGNIMHSITNPGSGDGLGIDISNSTCSETTIVGNCILDCDTPISDSGTGTFGDGTLNNIA